MEQTSPEALIRAGIHRSLASRPAISAYVQGIFQDQAFRASTPYIVIGLQAATPVKAVSVEGRDYRISVSLWDRALRASPTYDLIAEIESAVENGAYDVGTAFLNMKFIRRRTVASVDESVVSIAEYTARYLTLRLD